MMARPFVVLEVFGARVVPVPGSECWTRRGAERRRRREHREARRLRLPGIVSEALHYDVARRPR